jgi:hypothetical protein
LSLLPESVPLPLNVAWILYVPAGVFAGRVYVALLLPWETGPDVAGDPTGVVPLITENVTVPPSTIPDELVTFATRVNA